MEGLQAQLAALVDAAVNRVLVQHSVPSENLLGQLQAAQLEARELRAALAEVQVRQRAGRVPASVISACRRAPSC